MPGGATLARAYEEARIERQIAGSLCRPGKAKRHPATCWARSLISCRETVIGFPWFSARKAFLTRDFSVLCAPASWCCTWFSVAQGASWNGNDCRTVLSPLRKKAWVRKHCREVFMLSVASAYFALPVNLLRYAWHGAGELHRGGQSPPPLYPRAPASKIAATRSLRLIPAEASGRAEAASVQNTALSPHPCGLPPAFRERLSDFEAATPAVSATMVNKLTTSRTDRRPGKSPAATRHKTGSAPAAALPGGATLARAYEGRELSAKSPGRVRRSCHPAKIRHQSVARIRRHTPPSGIFSAGAVMPLTRLSKPLDVVSVRMLFQNFMSAVCQERTLPPHSNLMGML